MINTHNGVKEKGIKPIFIDNYPAIKKHLDQFKNQLKKEISDTMKQMKQAAAELNFELAAQLRDQMVMLKKHLFDAMN